MMKEQEQTLERKKMQLIEQLLMKGIYKTSDQKHLYDVPICVLETEYDLAAKQENDCTI